MLEYATLLTSFKDNFMETFGQVPPVSYETPSAPNLQKPKWPIPVIAAAVVVLLFGGAALGYWLKSKTTNPSPSYTGQSDVPGTGQTQNFSTSTAEQTPPDDPAVCNTYFSPTRQLSGEIAWIKAQSISALDIFANATAGGVDTTYIKQNSKFYKVGTSDWPV
ncbi:MAG: hypothetical protein M1275_03120 [Patescibacteria group bacterium]|nr:hypothetical protein [Patescibacteria group bacterium]